MYQKLITHNELIDMMESQFGDVYENIKEGDTVIELRFVGSMIKITIDTDS